MYINECDLLYYLTRQPGVLSPGNSRGKDNSWRKCPDVSVPNLFKGIATLFAGCCLSLSLDREAFYIGWPLGMNRNVYFMGGINTHTHWTVLAIMFFLCRIASCPMSAKHWTWAEKIADCSKKTYLVHFPAKDVKHSNTVMSNTVCSVNGQSWRQHCEAFCVWSRINIQQCNVWS